MSILISSQRYMYKFWSPGRWTYKPRCSPFVPLSSKGDQFAETAADKPNTKCTSLSLVVMYYSNLPDLTSPPDPKYIYIEGVFELLNYDTEFRIDGLVEIRQQSAREEPRPKERKRWSEVD